MRRSIAHHLGVSAPAHILLAPEDGRTRAWLYRLGAVIEEQVAEDGRVALSLHAGPELLGRLEDLPTVLLQRSRPVHTLPTPAD